MPTDENQREIAINKISEMKDYFDNEIVTTIEEPINFTIAEQYHHDYYARNPIKDIVWQLLDLNYPRSEKNSPIFTSEIQ